MEDVEICRCLEWTTSNVKCVPEDSRDRFVLGLNTLARADTVTAGSIQDVREETIANPD